MKNPVCILILFMLMPCMAMTAVDQTPTNSSDIYQRPEQSPAYPGGEAELFKFISKNLKYPPMAEVMGIQGQVIVRFVVGTDGKVKNAEIVQSLDTTCNAEAIRIVNAMPKWTPAKNNGEQVSAYLRIPITFKLAGSSSTFNRATAKKPLIIVNGFEKRYTEREMKDSIRANKILKMTIIPDSIAEPQYGEKAKDGAIIFELKK